MSDANVPEDELIEQGALPPDDFTNDINRIQEIAEYELQIPADLKSRLAKEAETLLVDDETLLASAAALEVGHLVLQGPPGTGKSSLARALCRAFNSSSFTVTAHEDWSTFEVVGRQAIQLDENGQEQIVPVNGFFTEAAIKCAGAVVRNFDRPEEPQATWLLIDELNRAHLDRAFGELFTVLGTDELVPITLPHQEEGNRELITPRRFRIIATLNSIDRQFVNGLSQGLRRRFTFITLDVPPPSNARGDQDHEEAASLSSREFNVVVERAAERVAKRVIEDESDMEATRSTLKETLLGSAHQALVDLFDLAAKVRYAEKGSGKPHLAIGTAQLIDTVELFIARVYSENSPDVRFPALMDWAVAVKLAPLFDADTISPAELENFATQLDSPFDAQTRLELLKIVAAGLYYVE